MATIWAISAEVYLKKQSMLSDIISLHFYKDNVSVTIVDRDGKVIFNTVPTMTRSPVNLTPQLKTYMSNNLNGSFVGRDYLVGYAGLKKSNWNIIVSTPSEVVTSMLFNTVKKISGLVLAILFFITTGVAFLSSRIAKPLEQLARLVQTNDSLTSPEKLSSIRAWYQEAYLLRDAMEKRFRLVSQFAALSDEAMTDPLTGLYNRRGFYEQLTYIKNLKNQCAIAVDIDHFKTINDRFGHSAGDTVLVHTADLLRLTCRKEDVISRFGGEEFVILLAETTLAESAAIAERIRQVISATEFSEAGHLTVSIGVAGLKDYEGDYERLLMEADSALYQAKRQGRNRVVVSGHSQ
jgi:diguanylate cyclase (GGDEF)-like protein